MDQKISERASLRSGNFPIDESGVPSGTSKRKAAALAARLLD
jgi:hypothetical protein